MVEPVLLIQDLVFDYPNGKRAVDGVSMRVEPGAVVALVGRNGAGKTTLLRTVAVLDRARSGYLRIDGLDAHADPVVARRRLGFLPDLFGLDSRLTVRQVLRYAAAAQKIGDGSWTDSLSELADRLNIRDLLNIRVGRISRGQLQRVGLVASLVHRPKLLLLDEPASGLDPIERQNLSQLIRDLADEGHTLIVSSHILGELEEYATHMIVLDEGRVIEDCPIDQHAGKARFLRLVMAGPAPDMLARLQDHPLVSDIHAEGDTSWQFHFAGDSGEVASLLADLVRAGQAVTYLYEDHNRLGALYRRRIGESTATSVGN